jgi:hypothetical protein
VEKVGGASKETGLVRKRRRRRGVGGAAGGGLWWQEHLIKIDRPMTNTVF